ncbi:trehalose hydrolase [Paraflavitalea sp. CAU 1676]|uniref:glycosyl hydrolase family 95 catalytic domain-containing protein n=1 Tax=Paraflavitalea sp. CAU 1676 TaxID=3032598 RepID=UPI0023DADEDB|nr:trehalose hydrolase [Paraflavitalea sp. CAU 1676]MDF2189053.1 trehalose hydrolase [Paraflavitalea sp. CAU 1676]
MKRVAFLISCFLLGTVIRLNAQTGDFSLLNARWGEPPTRVPTSKTPDGFLAGNGDIGLTFGGEPGRFCFYLGKNDCWRPWPVYPGGGIALPGVLQVDIDSLKDGDWYYEQDMVKGRIYGSTEKGMGEVKLDAWVSATSNTVVATFTSNKKYHLRWSLVVPTGNASTSETGWDGDVYWATRSFPDTGLHKWPSQVAMAVKVVGVPAGQQQEIELLPGKPVSITVTLLSGFDQAQWKQEAIRAASGLTPVTLDTMRAAHERWWQEFWSKSSVKIGDVFFEHYYYVSQYLLACASRAGKFAPGIWGPFITKDSTAWGGDYHLNYNYQAPYWAAYSSNHIDLTDNFDQPLLDYMDSGRAHAKQLLGVQGIYYPVGIGPRGLVTTLWPLTPEEMEKRYGTRENTIDNGYKFLGQKINAVFSVGNMMMRFYSTYDSAYAERVYPYILECANFWEDYLKFEGGRYVIYDDHFNEIMPRLGSTGNWRDRLGDFNSTLSLGLVKMLFKGMLDMSEYMGLDADRREKWKHIYDHLSQYPVGEINGRKSLMSVEKRPWGIEKPAGLNRVSIHGLLMPAGVAGPYTDSVFNRILLNDVSHWSDNITRTSDWGNTMNNGIETCFPGAVRVGFDAELILHYLKARIAAQSLRNGWITAGGGGLETLAAVPLTVNEMLLQSYEGVVRVFPNWVRSEDASFNNLRAYGAFLVSSELIKGQVKYVQLLSEKGRLCRMENPWPGRRVKLIRDGQQAEVLRGDVFEFRTGVNESIRLTRL